MEGVPKVVQSEFGRVRKGYPFYVALKRINGRFYVYRVTTRWDRERQKIRSVSEYLGRITHDGKFIKRASPQSGQSSSVPLTPTPQLAEAKRKQQMQVLPEMDAIDKKLLTILSMNARADLSHLSKKVLGLKPSATFYRVKRLEQRYGVRYTIEVDVGKLGYLQFLITVKFIERIPKLEDLREILLGEPRVQLAMSAKGDFDLIIYALAKNSEEIVRLMIDLRRKLSLESVWNSSAVYDDYCFVPLREEFIDHIKGSMLVREHAVLKELVKKGTTEFTEIDSQYKFDRGRAQYSFHKLKEKGIIIRATASISNPPVKYMGIISESIVNREKFDAGRAKLLANIIEKRQPLNSRYVLVEDVASPDGLLFYMPVFNEGDLEASVEQFYKADLGVRLTTMIVTNIIVGNFCYRWFDNAYSTQQEILEREYALPRIQKTDYDETGRAKKARLIYNKELGVRGIQSEQWPSEDYTE